MSASPTSGKWATIRAASRLSAVTTDSPVGSSHTSLAWSKFVQWIGDELCTCLAVVEEAVVVAMVAHYNENPVQSSLSRGSSPSSSGEGSPFRSQRLRDAVGKFQRLSVSKEGPSRGPSGNMGETMSSFRVKTDMAVEFKWHFHSIRHTLKDVLSSCTDANSSVSESSDSRPASAGTPLRSHHRPPLRETADEVADDFTGNAEESSRDEGDGATDLMLLMQHKEWSQLFREIVNSVIEGVFEGNNDSLVHMRYRTFPSFCDLSYRLLEAQGRLRVGNTLSYKHFAGAWSEVARDWLRATRELYSVFLSARHPTKPRPMSLRIPESLVLFMDPKIEELSLSDVAIDVWHKLFVVAQSARSNSQPLPLLLKTVNTFQRQIADGNFGDGASTSIHEAFVLLSEHYSKVMKPAKEALNVVEQEFALIATQRVTMVDRGRKEMYRQCMEFLEKIKAPFASRVQRIERCWSSIRNYMQTKVPDVVGNEEWSRKRALICKLLRDMSECAREFTMMSQLGIVADTGGTRTGFTRQLLTAFFEKVERVANELESSKKDLFTLTNFNLLYDSTYVKRMVAIFYTINARRTQVMNRYRRMSMKERLKARMDKRHDEADFEE